jgi:hypothetical protein
MDEEYPMKVGMTKKQWDEAVEGFGSETVKTYIFTTDDDVTKQIMLAGPNVMWAMCAYCHAGPMKLTNLYSNHYSKNKCPKLVFVDTLGKYMKKTKSQMEKDERKMKAKGKPKSKLIATGKTEEAKDTDLVYELKGKELQDMIDKEGNEEDDKIKRSSRGKTAKKKGSLREEIRKDLRRQQNSPIWRLKATTK